MSLFSSAIKLAAVDATEAGALADEYGVKGYPTIKYFPKGSMTPEDYDGGRTADTIVQYVYVFQLVLCLMHIIDGSMIKLALTEKSNTLQAMS